MILIGENIHIISKKTREALENRDEKFVKKLISIQENMHYADLNIGPGKGSLSGIFSWLCPLIEENSNLKISLDTTNFDEMKSAFKFIQNPKNVFLNSTTLDEPKLNLICELAAEYDCNIVALTMSKSSGIPKTSDGRMEIAFEIYEKCIEYGIKSEKIFFDPLIIPLPTEQSQAMTGLNTLKMIKESFDPPVNTIIGLSNISNGAETEFRPLINRVYATLAYGAGLDAVIADAQDSKLLDILQMLATNNPQNKIDSLYLNLAKMIKNFEDLDTIEYNKNNPEQIQIIKTCEIIMNKKIYSRSFAQV